MTYTKCDTLFNMSKAFNNVIIKARAKPIVTMFDEIRTYIMEIWTNNSMTFPNTGHEDVLPNIKRS